MKSWRQKSYEVLPALSVRGPELRRSLRIVTIAWACCIILIVCISGAQLKTFARMLGFNDFSLGVLSMAPFVAMIGQVWATIVIERTGLRKHQFIDLLTVSRILWLAVAAIPLLLVVPSKLAVVVMLAMVLASSGLAAMGMPAWWSWMGDLIPKRVRGRYMARRGNVGRIVQIIGVVIIGLILDKVTISGAPETAEAQPVLLWTICAIFAVGAIIGATDILLFRRIRELIPTVRDRPRPPAVKIDIPRPPLATMVSMTSYWRRCVWSAFRQVLVEPMAEKSFRTYVLFGAALMFSMSVGGIYHWRNITENLGFDKLTANLLLMGVGPLSGFFAVKAWGPAVDRWGRKPVLLVATVGTMFSIMPWFLATRGATAPDFIVSAARWVGIPSSAPIGAVLLGIIACTIGGASWSGVALAQSGIMLGFSDGAGRSRHAAAASVLISLGGAAGGLAGGILTESLSFMQDHPIIVGALLWNNWHVAFAAAWIARLVAFALLLTMSDPGAGRVRDMLQHTGANVYNTLFPRLFFRVRAPGWPRRKGNRRNNDNQ